LELCHIGHRIGSNGTSGPPRVISASIRRSIGLCTLSTMTMTTQKIIAIKELACKHLTVSRMQMVTTSWAAIVADIMVQVLRERYAQYLKTQMYRSSTANSTVGTYLGQGAASCS
jgi:hypothetical protein